MEPEFKVTFPRDVGVISTPSIEAYWYPSLGWFVRRLETFPMYPAPEMYYIAVSICSIFCHHLDLV